MLGFAQFNQDYHASNTNTPERYTNFLGSILHGDARTPDSQAQKDFAAQLASAINSGSVQTGQQLEEMDEISRARRQQLAGRR